MHVSLFSQLKNRVVTEDLLDDACPALRFEGDAGIAILTDLWGIQRPDGAGNLLGRRIVRAEEIGDSAVLEFDDGSVLTVDIRKDQDLPEYMAVGIGGQSEFWTAHQGEPPAHVEIWQKHSADTRLFSVLSLDGNKSLVFFKRSDGTHSYEEFEIVDATWRPTGRTDIDTRLSELEARARLTLSWLDELPAGEF